MASIKFFRPKLVIRSITDKAVRILGIVTIQPRETFDVFDVVEPTELYEDIILKALERPWGDLYREVVEKKSIVIEQLDLVSFHYSLMTPEGLVSINAFSPGDIPSVFDNERFEWLSSTVNVTPPLQVAGNIVSILKANATTDGYLSKEDWSLFYNSTIDLPIRIWQYQDYTAPLTSIVSLTSFENGSGLAFNAAYIVDGTATIVLLNNTDVPPTTTLSIPGKWLPGNRVTVNTHIVAPNK